MKNLLKTLLVSLIAFGCASNDDSSEAKSFCTVNNPVVDLLWLKSEIEQREQNITEDSKYLYISQAIHNDKSIIIYADCCPTCNSVYLVYNCLGENIGFIGDENFPSEILANDLVIWKANDFQCSF